MLKTTVQATRAHYLALARKASSDRIPLAYRVFSCTNHLVAEGTIYVIASNESMRRRELTRLTNRLFIIYPNSKRINASYNC